MIRRAEVMAGEANDRTVYVVPRPFVAKIRCGNEDGTVSLERDGRITTHRLDDLELEAVSPAPPTTLGAEFWAVTASRPRTPRRFTVVEDPWIALGLPGRAGSFYRDTEGALYTSASARRLGLRVVAPEDVEELLQAAGGAS